MQDVITKLLYFLSLSPFHLQAENTSWEKPEISNGSSQIFNNTRSLSQVQIPKQIQHSHFLSKREVKRGSGKKPETIDTKWLHLPLFGKFAPLVGMGITVLGLFIFSENKTIRFLFQFAAFDYVFSMVLSLLRYYTEKVGEKDLDHLLEEIAMEMEDFGSKVASAALLAKIYFDIFPPKQQQQPLNTQHNDLVLPPTAGSPKLLQIYTYPNQKTN